jgi:predicted O-linked N-acetylglucosamine transferase (SPINDLY family)
MLKFKNHWDCPPLRDKLLGRFEANGVPVARIDLISAQDTFHDHLACYHKADIGLDTFPFSGATTTFQALWMGVPVISRMGDRFIARMGGSLSAHAGLGDLAVESDDVFVEHAVALAADLPRLKELRATLRQRLIDSPLCDGPTYARNVEDAFRTMWDARAGGGKNGTP